MTRLVVTTRLVLIAALVWLASGLSVDAHELAQTQVAVVFGSEGRYRIDLCTDPEALLLKLQAAAAEAPRRGLSLMAQRQEIERLAPTLTSSLNVRFDRARSAPRLARMVAVSDCGIVESKGLAKQSSLGQGLSPVVSGQISPRILVQLDGTVAPNATSMIWSYTLMFGTYPLSVRFDEAELSAQWVEGIEPSTPIDISSVTYSGARLAAAAGEIAVVALGFVLIGAWRRRGSHQPQDLQPHRVNVMME